MRRIGTTLFLVLLALTPHADAATPTETVNGKNVLYLYGYIDADGDRPGEAGYDGDPFHPMRLDDVDPGASNGIDFARGMSGFKTALEEVGFNVSQARDAEVTLNASTLSGVDVLILGSNNRLFSSNEAAAVRSWVGQGGGLVAWSDSAFGGDFRQVGVNNETGRDSNNSLTEQFGLRFLTDGSGDYSSPGKDSNPGPGNKIASEGISQWVFEHYINNFQTDGLQADGITHYGEGVSFVRIDPSQGAVLLAAAQNPPGANPSINSPGDGVFVAETDAATAYSIWDQGRVVGTFDRNSFWNDGEGTDLFEVNNRDYAQRLVLWASGVGPVPEPTTATMLLVPAVSLAARRRRRRA